MRTSWVTKYFDDGSVVLWLIIMLGWITAESVHRGGKTWSEVGLCDQVQQPLAGGFRVCAPMWTPSF